MAGAHLTPLLSPGRLQGQRGPSCGSSRNHHLLLEWPAVCHSQGLPCKLPRKALPWAWCFFFAALQLLLQHLSRPAWAHPLTLPCPLAFSDCGCSFRERSSLRITQPKLREEGRGGSRYLSGGAIGRHPGEYHHGLASLARPQWKWGPHPDLAASAPQGLSEQGMQQVLNKC